MQTIQPILVSTSSNYPLGVPTFTQKYGSSQPYSVVVLNGKRYVPLEWEISNNAHGATGSANVTLAVSSNPDFSQELFRGDSAGSGVPIKVPGQLPGFPTAILNTSGTNGLPISDNSPVYIQVYAGFPSSLSSEVDITQLQLLWYGVVDQYSAAFTRDTVTFACRSFAAPLVDNKITRISMAETSVQFLQQAANAIGMTFTPVLPANYQPITIQEVLGQEFVGGSNFAGALYGKRIWDMALQCAMFDNVDVWVDKTTLFYAAPNLIGRQAISLDYGTDIELEGGLDGTHSPQFSRNVQVELHTYQPRVRTSHSVKIASNGLGGYDITPNSRVVSSTPIFGTPESVTTSVGADGTVSVTNSTTTGGSFSTKTGFATESGKERYIYWVANKSPQVLTNLGQSMWRSISQHEYSINVDIAVTPALLSQLVITSKLVLSNVPYRYFNATYFPRTMRIRMSPSEGFRVNFQAVNHLLPQGAV